MVTDNTLAYLEARVIQEVDAGTHTIFTGELAGADIIREGEPMTYAYYHKVKQGTTPKTAPVYVEEKRQKLSRHQNTSAVFAAISMTRNWGTPFEEIPDDWVCPVCGVSKSDFEKEE